MALGRTDGAPDTVDQADPWDAVIAEGTAFGDTLPLDSAADLGPGTPQGADDGLSDGADDLGSPSAPHAATTGDDDPATSPDPTGADPSTAPASPDTDPLAGAEPFTYTVGDETRTIEGAYRLPGDGLYVPEDRVPQFQLIASQAASLERQNRELYDRSQQWERLTSWQSTNAEGKVETLTGPAALAAQRVVLARSLATNQAIAPLLAGDVDPASMVVWDAEAQRLVWDSQALTDFKSRMQFEVDKAAWNASRHFEKLGEAPPPAPPPITASASPTINALIAEHKIDGLTDKDKQALADQFEHYVQQTPAGPQVKRAFLALMQDRAALRAEQSKIASAGKKADAFNAPIAKARQSAPSRPAPALPTGRNAPQTRAEPSPNELWATLTQEALESV